MNTKIDPGWAHFAKYTFSPGIERDGWLYISGTSAIFSWLSYIAMVYNHLQVEIPSLYGKNLRRDTIFLMGFFPLNATLAALLLLFRQLAVLLLTSSR